jgi:photosystem II stability/assembly factor-like uncharacterized protein
MARHLLNLLLVSSLTSTVFSVPSSSISDSLPAFRWNLLATNSAQQFRGLSPVSADIAWVAGTNGTVLRTSNGGQTWQSVGPSDGGNLEFRDVQAFSESKAVILSIGEGNASRIYNTDDGGATWNLAFTNADASAFYDCMAFDTPRHGLAVSDPVDGKFRILETVDGGASWAIVDPAGMPPALSGEFGFAASGTCIATAAERWYLASGGVDPSRIFRSLDGGHNWEVTNSAVAGGDSAGVYSLSFSDARHGIAVGGDYTVPNGTVRTSAWSKDGGVTWHSSDVYPGGYRSGSSWIPGMCPYAIAVGPTGSDMTPDGGKTWKSFDNGTYDSVVCVGHAVCWASGTKGRVAKLVIG